MKGTNAVQNNAKLNWKNFLHCAALVTVRRESKRLPDKALSIIVDNIPSIAIVIRRAKRIGVPVILCVPDTSPNDVFDSIAQEEGVNIFRGSALNKIKRWRDCFQAFGLEFALLVDGDDLTFCYEIGARALSEMRCNEFELICAPRNIIPGLFSYGINRSGIEKTYLMVQASNADTDVIAEFLNMAELRRGEVTLLPHEMDCDVRLTLDYSEDTAFYRELYARVNYLDPAINIVKVAVEEGLSAINWGRHKDFMANQQQFNQRVAEQLGQVDSPQSHRGWRFMGNELKYIQQVLDNNFRAATEGSMNEQVEALFARTHHMSFAVTFNSGTSTLHAALAAFGVGPGDEVLVPALTPAMCGFALHYLGAIPVFVDVLRDTFLIDPADAERKITEKTKAIMPVHIYGLVCDMDAIMRLAKRHRLFILEDCAQCFLGTDQNGRLGGTIGDVGSWSFETSKHITSGEGGIVVTNNEHIALAMRRHGGLGFKNLTALSGKVRIRRDKFQDPDWQRHSHIGYNHRMSELTAAVALAQIERLRYFVDLRIAMGKAYLETIAGSTLLVPQRTSNGAIHSYFTFAAKFKGDEYDISWRDFRRKHIENGGDGIYAAWKTLNKEPAFYMNNIGYGEVPVAESLQRCLMQFTTNQARADERDRQINALGETLKYFGDKV